MSDCVYTIGHSTHSAEAFVALLTRHGVDAVADVRSSPYSRYNPQYNRENLKATLSDTGIEYIFLGEELGARAKDRACYVNGKVDYERLAATPLFQRGLTRIVSDAPQRRIALMCAEKDPLACHRTILVARHVVTRGVAVRHILEDGAIEEHDAAMSRLLAQLGWPEQDLFRTREQVIEDAYRHAGNRIAYEEEADGQ